MANDRFMKTYERTITSPPEHAFAVTPSDTVDIDASSRALYVGGAGNLAVIMVGGETVTLTAVPAGMLLPLRVDRVLAIGTTATAIVALW